MSVEEIYKECIENNDKDGNDYNIFYVLGVEHDEVKICKIFADLLNPYGFHGQKDKFLLLFLKSFFQDAEYTPSEKCYACTQDQTDKGRFIDIAIVDPKFYIPFEVKFNAPDLANQCDDYIEYAQQKKKDFCKLIYITPNGGMPDEKSCKNHKENVKPVSFDDICDWLRECMDTVSKCSKLYPIIFQLIEALNSTTSKYDEKIKKAFEKVHDFVTEDSKQTLSDEDKLCLTEINGEYFRILCYENGFSYESGHGKGLPYLYQYIPGKNEPCAHFWLHYNKKSGFYPMDLGKTTAPCTDEIEITKWLKELSNNFKEKINDFIEKGRIKNAKM